MTSDLDFQLKEFVVVFKSEFTAEQLAHIPYWTDVDHIASISQSEFKRYRHPLGYHNESKPLARSTLQNGRRTFEIPKTPRHLNSPRSVTFSPKVGVRPIEKRRGSAESDDGNQSSTADVAHTLSSKHGAESNDRLVQDKSDRSIRLPDRRGAARNLQSFDILYEDLADLVPPEFDVISSDIQQIFIPSRDCDSDSVSHFSSEGE